MHRIANIRASALLGLTTILAISACAAPAGPASPAPASTTPSTTAAASASSPAASGEPPVSAVATPAVSAAAAYPICLLTVSTDTPYSAALNKAAAAEATKLGVSLTILSSEPASGGPADAQLQSSQMDECIAQKVKGVIVVAADAKAIVPAIKKASEAGIKVLEENAPVDPSADPYTIGFAGPGDEEMGKLAGKMAAEYLASGGNIAIVQGNAGYGPTIARLKGFTDYLSAFPSIKILDSQYADWSRQKAIQVSADQLTRFGNQINLFYTMDDDMAIGVAQSIQAANSTAKIVSLTAFPDSCPLIASGIIVGTAVQSGATDGILSVDTMVRALNGETVPRVNYMDTPQLNKDNLEICPTS